MIEVQKGIYLCNEQLSPPSLDTLVVVHPNYTEGKQIQIKQKTSNENYCQARDRVLKTWKNKGNVVVFEMCGMSKNPWWDMLKEKIMPQFEQGLYLIPTEIQMSDPAKTSWADVAKFLKSLNREILFIGGRYLDMTLTGKSKDYFHYPLQGCLGTAIVELGWKGIEGKIIEEACFY